ncbi:hypothetical protein V9T40_004477 [Parthenolecanium corni]|uniref:Uncharacterized protein n=1 Tax=Parthenolecanium corni TaxID=536013 RepID=A0AAN9YAG1_9HEMI
MLFRYQRLTILDKTGQDPPNASSQQVVLQVERLIIALVMAALRIRQSIGASQQKPSFGYHRNQSQSEKKKWLS